MNVTIYTHDDCLGLLPPNWEPVVNPETGTYEGCRTPLDTVVELVRLARGEYLTDAWLWGRVCHARAWGVALPKVWALSD